MILYKTKFTKADTSEISPDQLSLSVPVDLKAAEIFSSLTFGDQIDPSVIVAAVNLSPVGAISEMNDSVKKEIDKLDGSKIIQTTSGNQSGTDYVFSEYTYKTPDQVSRHGMIKVLRKDQVESTIRISKTEADWNGFATKAQVIVNSFRLLIRK